MDSLIHHLGAVLMEAREDAGISRERLAASNPDGVTTNTLFRFEKGTNARYWPRDPEAFVQLYADAIGVAPYALWALAVSRWAESDGRRRHQASQYALRLAAEAAQDDVARALDGPSASVGVSQRPGSSSKRRPASRRK